MPTTSPSRCAWRNRCVAVLFVVAVAVVFAQVPLRMLTKPLATGASPTRGSGLAEAR